MDEKISQIKFDKNFIKKLLEKLKVGNTRSIHLNALPGRSATRLDLFQLSSIKDIYPSSFLEVLLKDENFSFDINFDNLNIGDLDEEDKKRLSLISKRLNTLVIENDDNFLEYGIKNFGFGFPLLIKRDKDDPSKIIKAPLFIWNLDIKRSYREKNHWTICREEDAAIKINELLISHLSKDELIQLEKIPKEILEDGILDEQELLSLCNQILSQLNVDDSDLKVRIEKCPEQKFIESVANSKPWIQWSGIFGIYRSQKETIIHATEELLEHFDEFENENLILEKFQTSTISPVETDPSKEEIINTLTKDEIKLIQGPPGTGKSQSITAIISNVLANSGKCLVVCEKKTALDIIDTNLKNMGLGDFVVLIDDVNKDRKKVIEQARNISDNPGYTNFSKLDFQEKTRKFLQLKDDLNAKYAEVSKKVFGDFSWKQLIGLFIRYSKTKDFEAINESLECEPLKFDHEEYTKYLNIVEESAILYSELESDSEKTFSLLSPQIFSDGYK